MLWEKTQAGYLLNSGLHGAKNLVPNVERLLCEAGERGGGDRKVKMNKS